MEASEGPNPPLKTGPWKTAYSRFYKWRDDGTFQHIFAVLGEDADTENLSLDSTSLKSAGAKKGL